MELKQELLERRVAVAADVGDVVVDARLVLDVDLRVQDSVEPAVLAARVGVADVRQLVVNLQAPIMFATALAAAKELVHLLVEQDVLELAVDVRLDAPETVGVVLAVLVDVAQVVRVAMDVQALVQVVRAALEDVVVVAGADRHVKALALERAKEIALEPAHKHAAEDAEQRVQLVAVIIAKGDVQLDALTDAKDAWAGVLAVLEVV
jgi:hypothetical protein